MDKRVRSPNYPAFGLPEAIEKASAVYREMHTHAGPREVIAKAMGFGSLNGASATAISALHKYGLLDRDGDEVRVSERALRILHPHSPQERARAVAEAGRMPALFAELAEKFPGRIPNEELLRNYLVRRGFAQSALGSAISAFLQTTEMIAREGEGLDPGAVASSTTLSGMSSSANRSDASDSSSTLAATASGQVSSSGPAMCERERSIGRYDFEGGAHVRIVAGGDVDTGEALDMVETLIQLKRRELERVRRSSATSKRPDGSAATGGSDTDADTDRLL